MKISVAHARRVLQDLVNDIKVFLGMRNVSYPWLKLNHESDMSKSIKKINSAGNTIGFLQ